MVIATRRRELCKKELEGRVVDQAPQEGVELDRRRHDRRRRYCWKHLLLMLLLLLRGERKLQRK